MFVFSCERSPFLFDFFLFADLWGQTNVAAVVLGGDGKQARRQPHSDWRSLAEGGGSLATHWAFSLVSPRSLLPGFYSTLWNRRIPSGDFCCSRSLFRCNEYVLQARFANGAVLKPNCSERRFLPVPLHRFARHCWLLPEQTMIRVVCHLVKCCTAHSDFALD